VQARAKARTERFERFSASVCDRNQRFGSSTPLRRGPLTLRWAVVLCEEVLLVEMDDVVRRFLQN
jgi:hypothetical protein